MLDKLIETCVHRRVAAILAIAIVAAFGVRAYLNTPIEAFPDVTNAQVTVITQNPGYAPEEIERSITVPLERALNGTPRTLQLRSESLFGLSLITLTFDDDADPFTSRMHVAQRVAAALGDLPEGVVPELAPEATPLGEVYQFRMVSDRHNLFDLRGELQWTVARVLKAVPGVADVVCFGGYLKEVHVRTYPDRLRAHGVSLSELSEALAKTNVNVGGGFLRHGDQELTVRGIGYITSVEDIRRTVLKTRDATPVTVADVADIVMSNTPRRGAIGYNEQKEAVEGFVLMRRGENPSRVLEGLHKKIDDLNAKILPKGMRVEPFYDRTLLVDNTLKTVNENLLHGFILVVAVAWLFLRSLTGSLIVAAVIPLALLGAFTGLYILKMPANLISMGAIDFGILVDGAVVLVENVLHAIQHEKPERRRDVLRLIIRSANQVARPTLFAMLIIIAALVPVFTLEQVEGRIFRPLALTYSFALLAALVLSLTLVPALCALGLGRGKPVAEPRWVERTRVRYRGWLTRAVSRRRVSLAAAFVFLLLTIGLGTRLGTEFLPELDEGDFVVFVEMPPSIALEQAQTMLVEVRRRILTFPEVSQVLSENGRPEDGTDNENPNMSETFVRLKPRAEWRKGYDKDRLSDEVRDLLMEIPGVRYNISQPIKDNVEEAVAGVRGKVVLKVFGLDPKVMRDTLDQARLQIAKVGGVVDLGLYRDASVPQLQIKLDREAVARAGLTVAAANEFIGTALAGKVVTTFWEGERPVPVRLMMPVSVRETDFAIGELAVPRPGGGSVAVRDIAEIGITAGAANIYRESNSRYLALKFNVEGRDMGSVVDDAIAIVRDNVKVPEGYYFLWGGEFENQQRAIKRLEIIVPVALAAVLALLYSAIQSGRAAAAILLTAPFALTGGVFALKLGGMPLSVSAVVGFIALLGQVSLLGLLQASAIENFRSRGSPLQEAIVEGSVEKLRAILMAALLALFGLLPMALSQGIGSETQRPFALVIVGGMVTTLVITLFVLPGVYYMLAEQRYITPEEEDEAA
ncbi:MAG TPA: CusA/CzcA family heavy metal efflux RND transporter [Burkholderiales bacterium]|nr:CusA/CzcA family heavy metal efflux RND transporter [Burkholderiales bacterium]